MKVAGGRPRTKRIGPAACPHPPPEARSSGQTRDGVGLFALDLVAHAASGDVIVDDAGGLQVRVGGDGSDEAEAALFEPLASAADSGLAATKSARERGA